MKKIYVLSLLVCSVIASCTKEKKYDYQVNPVTVRPPGTAKPGSKTTMEFVSIAYYDLFGANISQTDLINLNTVYSAFGDKKLIEDMIIKNFLKRPGVNIPNKTVMRADIGVFMDNAYKKFYNRLPSETEKLYLKNIVSADTTISPEQLYYSLLTSNEYRHY